MTRYIDVKETAQLIRRALKRDHPDTKFSVRLDRYSGGASVTVKWTDGPTVAQVDETVQVFSSAGFDGSIDLAYSSSAWLHADGTVTFAETTGTEGSRGSVPSNYGAPLDETAELVHFGAHYVHTYRTITDEMIDAAEQVAPLHTSPMHDIGNGIILHCRGCGDMLDPDHLYVRGMGPGRNKACSVRCAAKVLVQDGIIRPSSRRVAA